MIPYDEDALLDKDCPKCDRNCHAEPEPWRVRWVDAGATYGDRYDTHWDEHLEVTCPRCGWSFEMAPRDAKVAVTA